MSNRDAQALQPFDFSSTVDQNFCLAKGDIHLWHCDLDSQLIEFSIAEVLSESETSQAARFVADRDRMRYIAGRIALRYVLSEYLRCTIESVPLAAAMSGKPYLVNSELHFNVSHSQNHWLCAVAVDNPVGVDIEVVRDLPDCMRLAEVYFSQAEKSALAAIEPGERSSAFLRCWTRKEACLKLSGVGIVDELAAVNVGIGPEDTQIGDMPSAPGDVFVRSFSPLIGVVGALGILQNFARIDYFNVPGSIYGARLR